MSGEFDLNLLSDVKLVFMYIRPWQPNVKQAPKYRCSYLLVGVECLDGWLLALPPLHAAPVSLTGGENGGASSPEV